MDEVIIMGDEQKERQLLGLSQFDVTVILIVITLITAVALTYYLGRPAPREPMVAYLYPARDEVPNIWVAPLANPDDAEQVTFSNIGIYDFAVDNAGLQIAYTARDENTLSRDIYLLDLSTGVSERVTFCADNEAECFSPVFHPDNDLIAYVRRSTASETQAEETSSTSSLEVLGGVRTDGSRIWVLDLNTGQSQLLTTDADMQGHSPIWSADGSTIAYYNIVSNNRGVMVYNFAPDTANSRNLNFVPALHGSTGVLSPDGNHLIVPDISNRDAQVITYLKLIDFTQNPATFENFTDPDGVTDDITVEWHPDGEQITIARRYTDDRWTRGYQLYQVDFATGETSTLLYDEAYSHHFFTWDNTGDYLLMQRVPQPDSTGTNNSNASPEIWVLNIESGQLTQIAESAYLPRWVNP